MTKRKAKYLTFIFVLDPSEIGMQSKAPPKQSQEKVVIDRELKECPYCFRKFSPNAAKQHIERCPNYRFNKTEGYLRTHKIPRPGALNQDKKHKNDSKNQIRYNQSNGSIKRDSNKENNIDSDKEQRKDSSEKKL